MMDFQDLLASERDWFDPILKRQAAVTRDQIDLWRSETVTQRRTRISSELYDRFDGVVAYGPFAGLRLTREAWWAKADLGAMLLGIYEEDILGLLFSEPFSRFEYFVDIGAADGYYPCGLLTAGRMRACAAFEISPLGRETILVNARRNGVDHALRIHGEAGPGMVALLGDFDLRKTVVLIDIEGAEFDLLTAPFLEDLRHATILIEVHNWVDDFLLRYEALLTAADRFFRIDVIDRTTPSTDRFADLRDFPDDNRLLLVSEGRPCRMRFLRLSPKGVA